LVLDGAREVGRKGEESERIRFPAAARAEVVRGGLATTASGRRAAVALCQRLGGVVAVKERGEAKGDPEGAIPYLGSGWGAAEHAGHGGRRRRAELLGAAALGGRGRELEAVDRLWRSEAR